MSTALESGQPNSGTNESGILPQQSGSPSSNKTANVNVHKAKTLGIGEYNGTWGDPQMMHLLRRTLFGVSNTDYALFKGKTLSQSVDILLEKQPSPSPPINCYNNANYTDPLVPAGQTWVNDAFGDMDGVANSYRYINLKGWWIGLMLEQESKIIEKMVLFWHNHIAAQIYLMKDARIGYWYLETLRKHALGNFKNLIKDITVDSGMLVYLNGNKNTAAAPNENYARELQELFTVGKGPGSHNNENDVKAAARVLTGWQDEEPRKYAPCFSAEHHDTSDKQFSEFYDNTIIKGRQGMDGAKETDELIDMIFKKNETGMHLCRALYRWFVNDKIDSAVEKNVIEPLMKILVKNNYEITPVIKQLLTSEHFYNSDLFGCQIKNPVDHLIGACRQFGLIPKKDTPLPLKYQMWITLRDKLVLLNMDPGDPPNVAGWPAYYQDPAFQKLWINANTLPLRNAFTDQLASNGFTSGTTMKFDLLAFTSKLPNPSIPEKLIDDSTMLLSPYVFDSKEKAFLKNILLSGQKESYYWTDAYNNYVQSPNESNKNIILSRLSQYYTYIAQRAEYQLM